MNQRTGSASTPKLDTTPDLTYNVGRLNPYTVNGRHDAPPGVVMRACQAQGGSTNARAVAGIGRQNGLRIHRVKPCEFESRTAHQRCGNQTKNPSRADTRKRLG